SRGERECPLRNAAARSAGPPRAAATRRERVEASEKGVYGTGRRVVAGRSQPPSPDEGKSTTSETVFRDGPVRLKFGRAGRSGRPPVPARVQRSKAVERSIAYRGRKKQMA